MTIARTATADIITATATDHGGPYTTHTAHKEAMFTRNGVASLRMQLAGILRDPDALNTMAILLGQQLLHAAETTWDGAEVSVEIAGRLTSSGNPEHVTMQVTRLHTGYRKPYVLSIGADGWSLHAPGSTDEQIATGEAPPLCNGPHAPEAK
jgi:hypothetical protein